ncbi:MAG: hypothetical protein AAGD43_07300 [Pseudomonadota bacterium]
MTDPLFPELIEALREVLEEAGQDSQFDQQLTRLIANAYGGNADRKDVELLLNAVTLDAEDGH